jgi:hypothetical protein
VGRTNTVYGLRGDRREYPEEELKGFADCGRNSGGYWNWAAFWSPSRL